MTALRPGPPASGAAVAGSLARSLTPAEDGTPPPPWLLQHQARSFRQVLAALRRHRGALLADPVGSGKTYVSLAVADALNRGCATACLVPAPLLGQWEAAAARLGILLALCSHEQASRGGLPQGTRGLVIVDESHRFRNHLTKRYAYLASWLVGRPALLVTATPIVNHPTDLSHQLLLGVRDNALAIEGIVSIQALLASGCTHSALGQLVVENEAPVDARPRRISKISAPAAEEDEAFTRAAELLARLRLSSNPSVASLVRAVLLRAAGSSPAALAAALQRYRRLLLHARDALRAGRTLERSELRRFTGELGDQLVWWELLTSEAGAHDLELTDLAELEVVLPLVIETMKQGDAKLERLHAILLEERSTLVFTTSRETVRYIRERLSALRLAWCTGDSAGIGPSLLSRKTVLRWFREGAPPSLGSRHLVVTDVAAEGLDLQRAARVVHYDLPWTPVRVEQREGRAVRLGSQHSEVEVVRFAASPALEQFLRLEEILARKATLPAGAGLGTGGRHIWRWRAELAEHFGSAEPIAGLARVPSPRQGLLAGFALYHSTEPAARIAATVGWLDRQGTWTEAPEIITERLMTAAAQTRQGVADAGALHEYLEVLTPLIRDRLALT
ncbi:MAG TPA: DEAD/DEAH box helicase, partial [Gemmatimonadales bacterium]|nr:DEAD/DEAH box helicase [Gemmatimonadales bacterium]